MKLTNVTKSLPDPVDGVVTVDYGTQLTAADRVDLICRGVYINHMRPYRPDQKGPDEIARSKEL